MARIIDTVKSWFKIEGSQPEPFPIPFKMSTALKQYHKAYVAQWHQRIAIGKEYDAAHAAVFSRVKITTDLPTDDPDRVRYEKACNARHARESTSLTALAALVAKDEMKQYNNAWRDFYFSDAQALHSDRDPEERVSPSGHYKAVITRHATSPGCWSYTKAKVYQEGSDQPIAEIRRNYSSMWTAWVENHPANGHSYLLAGEDYQGQTVVDLTTGEKRNGRPKSAGYGFGFCWVAATPSPDGTMVAVEGCFWACPYEVVIYDFSRPDECPPFVEIHRESNHDDFKGWHSDNTCDIGSRKEVRKSDGKEVDDIEGDEYSALCDESGDFDPEKVEERWITYRWTRPESFAEKIEQQESEIQRLEGVKAEYMAKGKDSDWCEAAIEDAKVMKQRLTSIEGNV